MTTKTVYQFDLNGVYIGPTDADESPLEPGVYLIPGGCVETAPPEVAEGHIAVWSGNAWSDVAPTPAPPPTVADLKAYAAAKRYAVETGGIIINEAEIDTSRDSQAMLTGAAAYVAANPDATVTFKATNGWVALSAAEVTAIALAVGAHVQACFAAEQAVDAAIDSETTTTTAEIDAWAWPSNS